MLSGEAGNVPRGLRRVGETKVGTLNRLRQAPIERGEDGVADGGAMSQDVVVPEAEGGEALLAHEFVAASVVWAVGVLGAVDLDDELRLPTGEVCDVWSDGELAHKVMSAESLRLQFKPK